MITIATCPVVNRQQLNKRYCLIGLAAPEIAKVVQAGQFINVSVSAGSHDPLLKRPFSVHRVDRESGVIYILFKLVGRGTQILQTLQVGASVQIMGPLGNGFTLRAEEDVILVGGGIGAAPLCELAQRLVAMGSRVTLLLGLTDVQDLVLAEVLKEFAPKVILLRRGELVHAQQAGADGSDCESSPEQGLVTDLLARELQNWHYTQMYACGPKPMLAAVQKMLGERNELAQLLLEEKMGCGIGLCFSCTCKVKDKTRAAQWSNEQICTRGPVFFGTEVMLDA